jgi:hypothetical protein
MLILLILRDQSMVVNSPHMRVFPSCLHDTRSGIFDRKISFECWN